MSVKDVVREFDIRLLFDCLFEADDSAVSKNYKDRDNIL